MLSSPTNTWPNNFIKVFSHWQQQNLCKLIAKNLLYDSENNSHV